MIILDSFWIPTRTENLSIGIVKGQDTVTGEIKYYIGTGIGVDQKIDEHLIRDFGNRLDPETMIDFLTLKQSDPKPDELPGQKKMKFKKNGSKSKTSD